MQLFIALGLVFFSGTTGLIYEVVWQKYLESHLGSHAAATAMILVLVMAISFSLVLTLRVRHRASQISRAKRTGDAIRGCLHPIVRPWMCVTRYSLA